MPLAQVPFYLALLGVGMIAGSLVGGWFADRALMLSIFVLLVWSGAVLALFTVAAAHPWSVAVDLFLIGNIVAICPALQTRLMDTAAEAQTLAAALNHSAFNLANALGAWLGGMVSPRGTAGPRPDGWARCWRWRRFRSWGFRFCSSGGTAPVAGGRSGDRILMH